MPPLPQYPGSVRNGVTSHDFGRYGSGVPAGGGVARRGRQPRSERWIIAPGSLFPASIPGSVRMAQYVYTMNRVGKVVPPKRVILKDISLSLLPGRQDRRARPERLRQVEPAAHHGGRGQELRGRGGADAGHARSASCRRSRSSTRRRPCARRSRKGMGEVLAGARSGSTRSTPPTPSPTPTSTSSPPSRRSSRRSSPPPAPTPTAAGDRRRRAAPAAVGREDRRSSPAARSAASRCAGCCCPSPTCCCSTSRPTTSTPRASSGSSSSCRNSPAPSSRSRTTATSSTTPPSGSSSSTAATASRGRATTASWLEQKEQRLETEAKQEAARIKAMKQELEWVRQNPKGRQAKSKARLARFEELASLRAPEAQRDAGDLHPGRRAPRRRGDRVQERQQGLRRPAADRQPVASRSRRARSSASSARTAPASRRCSA